MGDQWGEKFEEDEFKVAVKGKCFKTCRWGEEVRIIKVEEVNEELLREVVRRIVSAVDPEKIILFGSHAYGEPKKGSDLDILVVVQDDVESCREVASEVYGALCGLLIPKDVIVVRVKDIEEWKDVPQAFITKIVKKGRVLYEKQN